MAHKFPILSVVNANDIFCRMPLDQGEVLGVTGTERVSCLESLCQPKSDDSKEGAVPKG